MRLLASQRPLGAGLDIAVMGCSKGAEVYSIVWAIRSVRPDLKLTTSAVDICQSSLEAAKAGIYSRIVPEVWEGPRGRVSFDMFERLTDGELAGMFEMENGQAKVRPWLREGIVWQNGDAADAGFTSRFSPQDIVVANRFLCHMEPKAAERCLRNVARLVKPGGHLFVSGVDPDVRTRVARELGWKPVTALLRDIYEGDADSLRDAWPLQYWGAEPLCRDRPDWQTYYASVFQVGERLDTGSDLVQTGRPGEERGGSPAPAFIY